MIFDLAEVAGTFVDVLLLVTLLDRDDSLVDPDLLVADVLIDCDVFGGRIGFFGDEVETVLVSFLLTDTFFLSSFETGIDDGFLIDCT